MSKREESKKLLLVDGDTGEIVKDVYSYQEMKNSQKEYLQKKEQRKKKNTPSFTNTNMESINFVCQILTDKELGFLMLLQPYINYDGELVKNRQGQKKEPVKIKDMIGIVSKGADKNLRPSFNRFKKKCLDNGIMDYNEETKIYSLDKHYIFKGAFGGMSTVSTLQKAGREEFFNLKHQDLAFLYKIQQFVHKDTMALAHNPEEDDHDKIEFIKLSELAEKFDMNISTLSRKFSTIHVGDDALVAKIKVAGEPGRYMMNPKYFWRGDYDKAKKEYVDVGAFFKIKRRK